MNRKTIFWKCSAALMMFSLSIFVLFSNASALDWKSYGTAKYYDYEYDADSILLPEDDTVRVWSKDTIRDNEGGRYIIQERQKKAISTDGYDKYLYTAHFIEFQCSSKQNRLLAMYDYNKEGVALYSEEFPHSTWTSIVPGSQASELHKIICAAIQRP